MRSILLVAALAACIAAAPMTANDYYQAGKAAQALGHFDEAATDYAQARALGFPNAFVAYRLATLRVAQHDTPAAVAELRKASGMGGITPESLVDNPLFAPIAKDPGYLAYLDGQQRAYHPCKFEPAFRALDFWVGDWNVTNPQGGVAGTSHVEKTIDDCAIFENWSGAYGDSGKSFTSYDTANDRWDQHWIASTGHLTEYLGGVVNGAVVMIATYKGGETRLTFSRNADGTVRQLFESSTDGGTTWTTGTDLLYTRATKP